jgi:hypothetical protein
MHIVRKINKLSQSSELEYRKENLKLFPKLGVMESSVKELKEGEDLFHVCQRNVNCT